MTGPLHRCQKRNMIQKGGTLQVGILLKTASHFQRLCTLNELGDHVSRIADEDGLACQLG